jgi:hypothetical protein
LGCLHVRIHDEEITIGHETGERDVLPGGLDLDFSKYVEEKLEKFGIRTVDIRAGKGDC